MSEFSKDNYGNYYRNGQKLDKDCFGNLSQTGFTVGRTTWFGVEENSLAATPASSTTSLSSGAGPGNGATCGTGGTGGGGVGAIFVLPFVLEFVFIGTMVYLFVSGSAELVMGGLFLHPIIGVGAALTAMLLYLHLYSYLLTAALLALVTSYYWSIAVFNWTNNVIQIDPDRLKDLAIVDLPTAWHVLLAEGVQGANGWAIVMFALSMILRTALWVYLRKSSSFLYLFLHPVESFKVLLVPAVVAVIVGGLLSLNWTAPKARLPWWQNEWNHSKPMKFDFTTSKFKSDWTRTRTLIEGCMDGTRSPSAVEQPDVAGKLWQCVNTQLQ
jgi:hypothetical protein